jgi:phosphoglycolate phosphatase-like HAD superfamily hydrolase
MWDFDGTLADSEKFFKNIVHDYILERGYNKNIEYLTDEFYYQNLAGVDDHKMFKIMNENNIVNCESTDDIINDFLDYAEYKFKHINIGELKIVKGMDLLLDKLNDRGISMLVATSAHYDDFIKKCYSLDNPVVNKLDKYSAHKVPDDKEYLNLEKYLKKTKPNPGVFIYALENTPNRENIDKVIIVEDSGSGVLAGKNFKEFNKNIKTKVIGFTGGLHKPNREKLLNNGADVATDNAEDLFSIISEWFD